MVRNTDIWDTEEGNGGAVREAPFQDASPSAFTTKERQAGQLIFFNLFTFKYINIKSIFNI